MKTETSQHAANLTHIVAALMTVEQTQNCVTDPYNRKEVEGLMERAGQIYDEILEQARFYQFKLSILHNEEGEEIEVTV
jgi:protein-tyrosine-phosphatase